MQVHWFEILLEGSQSKLHPVASMTFTMPTPHPPPQAVMPLKPTCAVCFTNSEGCGSPRHTASIQLQSDPLEWFPKECMCLNVPTTMNQAEHW